MASGTAMEFSVEAAGPCRKRVQVNVPAELLKTEYEASYTQYSKSASIRGFRPGKAPRALIEKRFGQDIATKVKRTLVDNAFDEALDENKLAPIADPELDFDAIEIERGKPVTFEFFVTVKPEFDLPDLEGIEVSLPAIDVAESDEDLCDSVRKDRERSIEDAALAQLVQQTAIELPQSLVEQEVDEMARRAEFDARLRGDSEADIAKMTAGIRGRTAEESARELKAYFILDKIVETERILVTETEVEEAVAQIATHYDQTGDQLYAVLREAGRLTGLRNQLRAQKARAKLRDGTTCATARP